MKPIEEELIEIHAERVFPLERLESYYTKPKVGLHRAHGRLFDGVSNLKAKYRKHGVYEPRARRSLQKSPTAASSSAPSTSNLPITPEEEETLEWLRCSTDDFGLCNEKWQRTNEQRKQRVHSNEKLSYLQEFPCLKRSWGHALLTADFDRWYPDNEHSLDDKLPLLKSKLLGISTGSSTRSPFVEELKQLAQDQNSETSNLALLLLLPHMVGPVHLKRKRISAAEVRQSFISHIEEPTKILEERQKRQARYQTMGLTVQPYMIVAGPLKKIIAHHIVVDDIIYDLPTISKTVDTCFKIIWALNLEYPSECLPVWQFLERAIYKFPANTISKTKLSGSVQSLLNDCGLLPN
ncbi:uncharacterized protein [Choristoneura fumiferana]|uniref:uncharacterized protein n=1 Tax=Choristoneura fumiferana TaxID=7141 RepID=UPI003D15E5A2